MGKEWITKTKHFLQTFMYRVFYRHIDGYTFTTKNNAYKIYSNTYSLSKDWERKLVVAGLASY